VHADLSIIWDTSYRPSPARAAAAAAHPAGGAEMAAAAPGVTILPGAPAAPPSPHQAQLRELLTAAKTHHGGLSLLEHDLAQVPGLLASHQELLAGLARLAGL
jgi:hypothetical protein